MLKPAFRRPLRDSASIGRTTGRASPTGGARLRRATEPLAPSRQSPYVGKSGVCHQGRHPCLGVGQGFFRDLRACAARKSVGNRAQQVHGVPAGGQVEPRSPHSSRTRASSLAKDDPRIDRLLREVKQREAAGLFLRWRRRELRASLLTEMLGSAAASIFDVESYRTSVERRHNSRGEQITVTEAVVKIVIGGTSSSHVNAGRGQWPGQRPGRCACARISASITRRFIADHRTGGFQGPYSRRRHGRGHPCTGRKPRWHRRALVSPIGVSSQHHRRLI